MACIKKMYTLSCYLSSSQLHGIEETIERESEREREMNMTFVTLGWSSLCQTATSCVKAALREAISASDLWPSSPQSRSLTVNDKRNELFENDSQLISEELLILCLKNRTTYPRLDAANWRA